MEYGEGGTAHGWNRSTYQLVCLEVPPAPVYKGGRGRCGRPYGCAWRSPTPTGSRTPPSCLVGIGRRKGERGKGGAAPLLVQFRLEGEGARGLPWPPLLFSTKAHGGPLNPQYSGKIPISPGTLPISKYMLPIYQSLCLDHFETPRHVRDHIRDSELSSVHQNT